MQNVVAINAAARQSIIAAQATSDEMLLESIADGSKTAMHILYARHNVRVYRFILRPLPAPPAPSPRCAPCGSLCLTLLPPFLPASLLACPMRTQTSRLFNV